MLETIRNALRIPERVIATHHDDRWRELDEIPLTYVRAGMMAAVERVALFEERIREYDASVIRVPAAKFTDAITARLQERGKSSVAIPDGIPEAWLPEGFSFIRADSAEPEELDRLENVLTGCTVAVAGSGTIVLQHGPLEGTRKLTLLADYHLCLVWASQIVETLPEAFERICTTKERPATFISGPSATSDIEMTRVKGVHGPRVLDVVIVV